MAAIAREAVAATLGAEVFGEWAPWMGAEDFAVLQQHAPGCFFWLGAALPERWRRRSLRIPIRPEVESLNAAAAVSVALYEWGRRKGLKLGR